jgi:hypothetical protein
MVYPLRSSRYPLRETESDEWVNPEEEKSQTRTLKTAGLRHPLLRPGLWPTRRSKMSGMSPTKYRAAPTALRKEKLAQRAAHYKEQPARRRRYGEKMAT